MRGTDCPRTVGFVSVDRRRLFRIIAILAAASAYATIVLGGTVGAMGAGLACPDWPLCHGSIVPDLSRADIAIEYAHRLMAALTSLFILLTLILSVAWFRSEPRLVTLSIVAFALLATQIGFGALTITSGPDVRAAVVTIHLALGAATLAAAVIVALLSWWPADATPPDKIPGS